MSNGNTAPAFREGIHDGDTEMKVLVVAIIVAMLLSWLFLWPGKDRTAEAAREAYMARMRGIALTDAFPVDERASRASCARFGKDRDSCLASENELRAVATERWQAANRYVRLRCIKGSEKAPGPAGYLFACIGSTPADLDW